MSRWESFGKKRTFASLKRVIVIAAEGEITEPEYFQRLNSMSTTAHFHIVANPGNGSSPRAVLARMKAYLKESPLNENDEAWIVLDCDDWPDKEIENIKNWAQRNKSGKYHLAMSKQRFEDWLKLHVDNDKKAQKKFHPMLCGKNKHILDDFITKERVIHAINRAKQLSQTSQNVGNVFEILESFFRE